MNIILYKSFLFLLLYKKDKPFLSHKGTIMLDMVIVFLVLAIIAGGLGFSGVEIMSIEIARVLFFIFQSILSRNHDI